MEFLLGGEYFFGGIVVSMSSVYYAILSCASYTHGYCYRGKRCHGIHDWHAKGRINVIGAMVGFVLVSVGLFEGIINSDVFYAWLTQALVPV